MTRTHFVGIGGAGMSALARLLLQRGEPVSGSDLHDSPTLDVLRAMGAAISVGHRAEAVVGAGRVVVSSAVPSDNPEVVRAGELGIPVLHRAQLLAELMDPYRRVCITGTHGKTTTTCMTVVALQAAGGDPSFAIGAALNEAGANAHHGSGPVFVAEADESDRSLLVFEPDVAVVTNVDLDHPDTFPDLDSVIDTYVAFLDRRRADGVAVVCADDPHARRLAARVRPPVLWYGEDPTSDVRLVVEGPQRGHVHLPGGRVRLELAVPGRHNLLDAAAALAVCDLLGVDLERAAEGLRGFRGAQRRFQIVGEVDGVVVVDDYAHHPTELRVTLAAARSRTAGRVILVVQPHRASRTAVLGADLGRAAAAADVVVVTEVYLAGEPAIPGVSGRMVADAAEAAGAVVRWVPHLADVPTAVAELVRPGDLVLITGAGDVTTVGPALLALLEGRRG